MTDTAMLGCDVSVLDGVGTPLVDVSLTASSEGYSGSGGASYSAGCSELYSAVTSARSSGCGLSTSATHDDDDHPPGANRPAAPTHRPLPEPERAPWAEPEVLEVLRKGRPRRYSGHVTVEMMRRLSRLLQRPLVRISREAQRLSVPLRMCAAREMRTALAIVLGETLAQRCLRAGADAVAAAGTSWSPGGAACARGRSARCRLRFSVGKFHRWLIDAQVALLVRETAAILLAAAMETLLEEIVLISLASERLGDQVLTVESLENGIASSAILWGLLQRQDHLACSRDSNGSLSPAPPLESVTCHTAVPQNLPGSIQRSVTQCLLATSAGSVVELGDLVSRAMHHWYNRQSPGGAGEDVGDCRLVWSREALLALYYYVRERHVERNESPDTQQTHIELQAERSFDSLPPLVAWIRVAAAHTRHRASLVVDGDDVRQASRLLLPDVDCLPRQLQLDEELCLSRHLEMGRCIEKFHRDMAFHMLSCGRIDVLPAALKLLGREGVNTINEQGMTPLMYACVRGNEAMVQLLIDHGANMNIAVSLGQHLHSCTHPSTVKWTALTFAVSQGHISVVQLLLERGVQVEGAIALGNDSDCETPLQMAAAIGHYDLVRLLLARGARDSANAGGRSALVLAATHGHRRILRQLLSQNDSSDLKERLSDGKGRFVIDGENERLELTKDDATNDNIYMTIDELLIEDNHQRHLATTKVYPAALLQEALYFAAENGYMEIALDLRNSGVPWTCYAWGRCVEAAYNMARRTILQRLLRDFHDCSVDRRSRDCPEFRREFLPLLFDIFRHSKKEATTLSRLVHIFSRLYGGDRLPPIEEKSEHRVITRIDPRYVNNPDLSDVQFTVGGRTFYAHKIVLANASSHFRAMLGGATAFTEGTTPTVQINDVRYEIFEHVMQYLYNGTILEFNVPTEDLPEVLDAAQFFQLEGLRRHCEMLYSSLLDTDTCVDIYKQAKRYSCARLVVHCEAYFLQNLATLHAHNDVFRRMLFSSKHHGYELVNGLLATLSETIARRQ